MKGYEGSGKQVGQLLWTADRPEETKVPKFAHRPARAPALHVSAESNVERRRPDIHASVKSRTGQREKKTA